MKDKKKIAVFISSGIGNAVMLVPLLRLSQQQGEKVTIILNSPFITLKFLKYNNFPTDEIIDLRNKNNLSFALRNINRFDKSYLDYSSSSVKNLFLAAIISKRSFVYRKNKLPVPGINYLKPYINMHAAVLHSKMVDSHISEKTFSLSLMRLKPQNNILEFIKTIKRTGNKIFSVQISSGNNKTKFKDWPVDYWIDIFKQILSNYNNYSLVLLGDKNEVYLGDKVLGEIKDNRIISLIGETTLEEASSILYNSDIYLGLDSGFMHLAVAYGIPTFTILGASNENFIGYHKFDNEKHFVIYKNLSCRPCHGWVGNNTSRVENPNKCPDFRCLTELLPDEVFKSLNSWSINLLSDF